MADQIQIGDVVRLKSGGPDMTVNGHGSGAYNGQLNCKWFDDKEEKHGWFRAATLEKVPVKSAS